MSADKQVQDKGEDGENVEEYIEEEDEDFNPEVAGDAGDDLSSDDDSDDEDGNKPGKRQAKKQKTEKGKSDDGDYDDFDVETEAEVKKANYSKIESTEGGLIKTRTQRALEEQQGKQFKSISHLTYQSSINIDDAWAQLKSQSKERLKHNYSSTPPSSSSSSRTPPPLNSNEKIKIKRKYEYAGDIVTEEKWVDRESAEAKQYLNSLKDGEKVESSNDSQHKTDEANKSKTQGLNEKGEKLRIVRKRPPLLEGILNGSIKPKFNTLEKSKVDFAKLVDKEGINDELVQHNKNGYLEKQDFLSRVQFHKDSQIKEIRKKELQNKNK